MKWHYIKINNPKSLPKEYTRKYSNDGHTESNWVVVWDSFFGPSIDRLWNGEWQSERDEKTKNVISPSVVHYKVAWAEIPAPEGYMNDFPLEEAIEDDNSKAG